MSMAFEDKGLRLEVSRGLTEDAGEVFEDAALKAPDAGERAYVQCLEDRARRGELGVFSLLDGGRAIGAMCYKALDGDAELVFGHALSAEAYFLEEVARSLFDDGMHTIRSNFSWPEPNGFIKGAQAMGFNVTERMGMCLVPRPPAEIKCSGFELLAWQDRHADGVCRVIREGQSPADQPVYPVLSRPEGARGLMESVMQGRHGHFLRELSYVAIMAGRPIGFLISTLLSDGSVLVLDVGVDKGYRRIGVGGTLLDRLIGDSHAKGYSRIVLAVTAANYDAIRLYVRKGFRVNGHFRQYVLSKIR